jgi:signal transduction histidine kinase/integral membrane sensor domain MASE1
MVDVAGITQRAPSPLVKVGESAGPPIAVALLYLFGAEAAFFIGTLSDKIFAPIWPPNVVLFCTFLLVPEKRWWIFVLATFPVHVMAELGVGMTAPQLLVAFATNVGVAALGAVGVRMLLGGPPWLNSARRASLFMLVTVGAAPAIVAFAGAYVEILGTGPLSKYVTFWADWYLSNAVGSLTLAPVVIGFLDHSGDRPWTYRALPGPKDVVLGAALVLVCIFAFEIASRTVATEFLPALLYAPLPIVLWIIMRSGVRGSGAAILLITLVLIGGALSGTGLFIAHDPETNVLALQIFIVGLGIPMVLLGASVDQARDAEHRERSREVQMMFAARNASIGFWHLDCPTDRLWLTDHCASMLGLPREGETSRAALIEAVHPEDRTRMAAAMHAAGGGLSAAEFRVMGADGAVKWFVARSYTELTAHGLPASRCGFFADLTARKTAEAEVERQRNELARLTRISTLNELSGAIAHELNQPLAAILSNAETALHILANGAPNLREIGEILQDIVHEDARAGGIIQRVRALVKPDDIKSDVIDLNALATSTLDLLHSEFVERKVRVETRLTADLPRVPGDPIQLQQAFLNLVMNAIEAMGSTPLEERAITVFAGATAGGLQLGVADHGPGIAEEHKELVFQPFFTTKKRGLGLGLSICSTIAASHGGDLRLLGNDDGGTTAILQLPTNVPKSSEASP